jgi:hypothetical protein
MSINFVPARWLAARLLMTGAAWTNVISLKNHAASNAVSERGNVEGSRSGRGAFME